MVTVDPSGWTVEVTHPDTGRVRSPDVIDVGDAPSHFPGPNARPRVRLPVRKSETWLESGYADDGELKVWKDGERLGIEVLRDIEQREGETILIGVGGVELEQRVEREYSDEKRQDAVDDIITNETNYAVDTPDIDTNTVENVTQQSPDTTAEFEALYSVADAPIVIENDGVRGAQIAWTVEGELADRFQQGFDNTSNSFEYSAGDYWFGSRGPSATGSRDFAEWDFTPERDIPSDEFGLQVRDAAADSSGIPALKWTLIFPNGSDYLIDESTTVGVGQSTTPDWHDIGRGYYSVPDGYQGPDLVAGDEYTVRVEITDSNGVANEYQYNVDAIAPYDLRSESDLSFADTTDLGTALDGPGHFAPQEAVFDEAQSAFAIEGGRIEVAMLTIGAQRVQLSNDSGATWLPNDGTENNTASVDVDFPSPESSIQTRIRIDSNSPGGDNLTIPARNYASQEIESYTLDADITQTLLIIEETFDDSIESVLTQIADPAERSWSFTYVDGTPTIRFVKNGQFEADYTPDFDTRTRERLGKTFESVTVKGSNVPVSDEPYTASTSPTSLVRENLLVGSETVYDDTQNYERGVDYDIEYSPGEITALSGGSLTMGDQYSIDYRYQARGTFTPADAPNDPTQLVRTVPGVTSTRLAEQLAFVVESIVRTPRYAADVTIPDPDPRFDPLDALPASELGFDGDVPPLEVRGEPEVTTEGLRVRFGTRPETEAIFARLSEQVSRVTDRS